MQNFDELRLPELVAQAVRSLGFTRPTPIQAQAIPAALTRRDLIGCAQTGTGKTAAFSIPILLRLMKTQDRTALVLVPTRELALQIEKFWVALTKNIKDMPVACLIGGASMKPQLRALDASPRLIVATPGRLLDHVQRGSLTLSRTEILVLDEADRMLDLGFAPQLNQILRYLPKTRQTLLFSATLPESIEPLLAKYMKDPIRVSVDPPDQQSSDLIQQAAISVTMRGKNEALLDEINDRKGSVLVFTRTQTRTDRVARYLGDSGVNVGRIHGARTQGQRTRALDGFRSGEIRVLVATDIAARGIDVAGVAHVINYDLPMVPEDYVHRVGRTGRAGNTGEATSFITPEDHQLWRAIVKLLQKRGAEVPTPKLARNAGPEAAIAAPKAPSRPSGGQGQRPQRRGHRKGASGGGRPPAGSGGSASASKRRRPDWTPR